MGATKTVDGNLADNDYWKTEEIVEGNIKMDFRDTD
jgi:hypothetical protein